MFGRCVLLNFVFLFSLLFVSVAQAAKTTVVTTDGAIVYKQANFDSPILGYFRAGQKIAISSKKFGQAFYRVRFKQGVLGYIADVDVEGGVKKTPTKNERKDSLSESEQSQRRRERPRAFFARKYMGLTGGLTRYTEILNAKEYRDQMVTYGAKVTLPISFLDGPFFFDINLVGSTSAPKFYRDMSTIPPKGWMFLGATVINYPLFDFSNRRGLFYIGGGPVLAYSTFLVEVNSAKVDTTEMRLGAVFNVGMAFDLGGAAFRLEPKFYIEKASYNSYDIALLFEL